MKSNKSKGRAGVNSKRWFRKLLERRLLIILMLLLQVIFLADLVITGSQAFRIVNLILNGVSILAALYIVSQNDKGAYKLRWIILIHVMPLFGGLFYLMSRFQASTILFSDRKEKGSVAL